MRTMRTPRTPLAADLQRIGRAHDVSRATGVPVDEVLDGALASAGAAGPAPTEVGGISRRNLLAGTVAGGAALAVAGIAGRLPRASAAGHRPTVRKAGAGDPNIVIVGAGGAGTRCALALADHGIQSTVYEGADRIGGRMWTLRNFFADGQTGEHGGGFVSSEHTHMRGLVKRFGLALENIDGGSIRGLPDTYYMQGDFYSRSDIIHDWGDAYGAFHHAASRAPWPQRWNHHTHAGVELDHISVPDWVEHNIPGGTESRFGQLMLTNVLSEYGGPLEDTSALNLIYLLADDAKASPFPLDGTNEKWHVVGGNDLVISNMVAALPADTIETGTALLAARDGTAGATVLTFQSGQRTFDVVADMVVFALPFRILRTLDLSGLTLSDRKRRAINTQGLGTNLKLHVQVAGSPWEAHGRSGGAYSDPDNFEEAWVESVGQPGTRSLSLGDLGGAAGVPASGADHAAAPAADVSRFLGQIEPLFPGMTAAYEGLAYRDAWSLDPWHRGAYSYYKVGQFTDFGDYEGRREGNHFFCGEHTSFEFQGYMEGAIRSGEAAAAEIRSRL
jgi:monoamine oxidase